MEDVPKPNALPLFTTEAFALVKARLAARGIFALWISEPAPWPYTRSYTYFDILHWSLLQVFPFVYKEYAVFIGSRASLNMSVYRATKTRSDFRLNTKELVRSYLRLYNRYNKSGTFPLAALKRL